MSGLGEAMMRFACHDCLDREGVVYRTLLVNGPILCDLCGHARIGGTLLGEARDTEPVEPRRVGVGRCSCCPFEEQGMCITNLAPPCAKSLGPDLPAVPPPWCPLRDGDVVVGLANDESPDR